MQLCQIKYSLSTKLTDLMILVRYSFRPVLSLSMRMEFKPNSFNQANCTLFILSKQDIAFLENDNNHFKEPAIRIIHKPLKAPLCFRWRRGRAELYRTEIYQPYQSRDRHVQYSARPGRTTGVLPM